MVCHRKLWLFANGMQKEHTSELVEMGKLNHEREPGLNSRPHDYESTKTRVFAVKQNAKRCNFQQKSTKSHLNIALITL